MTARTTSGTDGGVEPATRRDGRLELNMSPTTSTGSSTARTSQSEEANEIKIPPHSFTASRFLYADANEISASSTVVLLGEIPWTWYKEQHNHLVSNYQNESPEVNALYSHGNEEEGSSYKKDEKLNKLLESYYDAEAGEQSSGSDYENEDEDNQVEDDAGDVDADIDVDVDLHPDNYTGSKRNSEPCDWDHDDHDVFSVPSMANTRSSRRSSILRKLKIQQERPVPDISVETFSPEMAIPLHEMPNPPAIPGSRSQAGDTGTGSRVGTEVESFHTAFENPSDNVAPKDYSPIVANESSPKSSDTVLANTTPSTGLDADGLLLTPQVTTYSTTSKVRFDDDNLQKHMTRASIKSRISQLRPTPTELSLEPETVNEYEHRFQKLFSAASHTKHMIKKDIQKSHGLLYKRFYASFKPGEIMKAEKMLVLVKTIENASTNTRFETFTEQEPCDTRIYDRWKEYMVIARSTGNPQQPIILQFRTKRTVVNSDSSNSSYEALSVTLSKSCIVNFYSALDRTIALVKGDKVYILRCQVPSSSIRWLSFLSSATGGNISNIVKLSIPSFNMALNINVNRDFFRKFLKHSHSGLKLLYTSDGYIIQGLPAVEYLSKKIKKKLIQAGLESKIKPFVHKPNAYGLCWRYYDRLEWLFGETLINLFWEQAMYRTHELELRAITHYPRTVDDPQGKILHEQPPLEGFLLRLTTKQGQLKRGPLHKQVFTFEYFFTSGHLLFFKSAYKSFPPLPYSENLMTRTDLPAQSPILEEIKSNLVPIFTHNPYTLDENNHIEWLNPNISPQEFEMRDRFAFAAFKRRITSISNASKVLNLTDVQSVGVFDPVDIPKSVEVASSFYWGSSDDQKNILHLERSDTYFYISLKNGSRMVLKAPSVQVRDEWVHRLQYHVKYWSLRIHKDHQLIKSMKETNIENLHMDEFAETDTFAFDTRWEKNNGTSSTEVYNVTSLAMFRPVSFSGYIYQKPKKHSKFKKYFATLIPGHLILFNVFVRDITGYVKPITHYTRYASMPLRNCYIYSGTLCDTDLLDRLLLHDSGKQALPRVYEDGWLSSDDESSRCFTIWFGTKRAISGSAVSNEKYNGVENPGLLHMVRKLGVTGRSMVFMCRSRQERDLWLTNLYADLERFGRSK
ncbi:Spo71p CYBJADRAFT_182229 [Cyberlindnera jadinii NRRL Y-1542]|uniref:PH domain-containing protein n=1 Tax=Cyberlindnera jadinii (strain ATCC 18201 / CBS 1600 / BCRC 20928 / JCM 3617 / NBRC 0987 / NRRL Y-1542) TaxID=983966 RepID=A0A1E4S909_CYBJN|nr:hypothetical protein CYBJADRAFT_182229 [Cyberlindnera jadinii NRRL Y-1542]ODV76027.1 hypothetical protein CYBJADRAFT_182229 [Cyberlindnera jadinii NRRL Y-1542]